jgi:hypothetical protein
MAKDPDRHERTPRWKIALEVSAVLVVVAYTIFAGLQWEAMHDAWIIEQRAWVSVVVPSNFPLDGSSIPASIQIANTGKTPAKDVEGDIVATVLKKSEAPAYDFSGGHPHNRLYVGTIFPNAPISTTITVARYGPQKAEPITPTLQLRQEIASGESFIIFYGKISYLDVFGKPHWTAFCTASGSAIGDLRKCINYNDVDKK